MDHIQLSDHFGYRRLFRFTIPSIVMMIFTSIYGVVDGYFVSNYVGKTPFAAVNLIYPFLMILGSLGFMFGAGGSALIAKTLGERKPEKARKLFSLFVYVTLGCGAVLSVLSILFLRPIARLLGAEGQILEDCVVYGRILLAVMPVYMLQFEFQNYFVTAEKPQLGLYVTVISGVTNMVLDWLFMAVLPWGIVGAALASAIAQAVGGVLPLIYFARPNDSLLRLGRAEMDGSALIRVCINGSSELMSNVAMSLVSILYNIQLLKFAGEDGVAAYGVLMYVNFVFLAIFIGYSTGVAPVVGFNYGAQNHEELKGLLRRSTVIILSSSLVMFVLAETLGKTLAGMFVGYDRDLMDLTTHAFAVYSFSFLFSGIAIFGSAFFTALNDGLTSALISFLRSLLFQVVAVMVFPLIWGIDGIWASIVAAELVAAAVTIALLAVKRKKYQY